MRKGFHLAVPDYFRAIKTAQEKLYKCHCIIKTVWESWSCTSCVRVLLKMCKKARVAQVVLLCYENCTRNLVL